MVSVKEKARGEGVRRDREDERERPAVDVSKQAADIKTGAVNGAGMSLAVCSASMKSPGFPPSDNALGEIPRIA